MKNNVNVNVNVNANVNANASESRSINSSHYDVLILENKISGHYIAVIDRSRL